MESGQLPEVPAECDHEPDVPISFYYFAFEAESPSALIDKRDELRASGVNVIDIVDHEWSKSIYFKDPHCLSLRVLLRGPQPHGGGGDAGAVQGEPRTHWIRCVLRSIATAYALIRRRGEAIINSVSLVRSAGPEPR